MERRYVDGATPAIRKAFVRLLNSSECRQIRDQSMQAAQLIASTAEGDRQQGFELDRKWKGKLITLAKRRGDFKLASWLRVTRHSFEIQ